jgi:hypothetical protein
MDQPWILDVLLPYLNITKLVKLAQVCKSWRDHIYKLVCPRGPNAISLRKGNDALTIFYDGVTTTLSGIVLRSYIFGSMGIARVANQQHAEFLFQQYVGDLCFNIKKDLMTIYWPRHNICAFHHDNIPTYYILKLIAFMES